MAWSELVNFGRLERTRSNAKIGYLRDYLGLGYSVPETPNDADRVLPTSQLIRTALTLHHVYTAVNSVTFGLMANASLTLVSRSYQMFNYVNAWFNPPPSLDILLQTLKEKQVALECVNKRLPLYIERAEPKDDRPDWMWDSPRRHLVRFRAKLEKVSFCCCYIYLQRLLWF